MIGCDVPPAKRFGNLDEDLIGGDAHALDSAVAHHKAGVAERFHDACQLGEAFGEVCIELIYLSCATTPIPISV
ncbi:MAG: hypothetical protein CFK49_04275 [Armatimonadetes bacterium JP3_11]|nr:MAG: hypothetical protein CFK49_04275 [Armatimonadetes bacterium JP3_11]RMH09225.1 MAG: hypothetical protein D6697_04235 [Armatimonadota bacterium]